MKEVAPLWSPRCGGGTGSSLPCRDGGGLGWGPGGGHGLRRKPQ